LFNLSAISINQSIVFRMHLYNVVRSANHIIKLQRKRWSWGLLCS